MRAKTGMEFNVPIFRGKIRFARQWERTNERRYCASVLDDGVVGEENQDPTSGRDSIKLELLLRFLDGGSTGSFAGAASGI